MKAALADTNSFTQFGHLHFFVIASVRTPSVSPFVSRRHDATAALAGIRSPANTQHAQYHRKDPLK
jgi:hypothetical protein